MENASIRPHVTKWGLILGLVSAVITILIYITELYLTNQWVGYLSLVFTIAFMYLACKEFKDENEGILPFGKAFLVAFLVGLIGILLSSVVNYIYISFVDPNIMQNIVDAQLEKLANDPNVSDEQLEATENMMGMVTNPIFTVLSGLFGGAFFSAILALIVGAIVKKNPDQ